MKKTLTVLALFSFFYASSQVNLLNGLQACYAFDCPNGGIAVNGAPTGSSLDGVLFGAVSCTTGHQGLINTGIEFAGSPSDFVRLPNDIRIKPTTSLTVSGWYFVTHSGVQDLVYAKNTCAGNFNGYNLVAENNTFQILRRPGIPGGCGGGALVISQTFSLNLWHHVVFYTDNVSSTIIVDNNSPVSMVHNIPFDYDTMGVILGGTNELADNHPFSGRMDNLKFWNRQLTPAEISTLYANDASCQIANTVAISEIASGKNNITLYPNPSTGNVHISNAQNSMLSLFDVTGRLIYSNENSGNEDLQLDLSGFADGVYCITITDLFGITIKTEKLILNKN